MKRVICLALIAMLFAMQMSGVLGVGDIVHDPISYINAVLMYLELIKSYEQLRLQYELLAWMSEMVPVNMARRYRAIPTLWLPSYPPSDRYGTLGGWSRAMNTGEDALAGYQQATEVLKEYDALASLPAEQQLHLRTGYGSVELTDGANVHSMQTLGTLRKNAAAVERTIQALEDDSLSQDPAMNTEIAVLNKINAASIISLRNTQDTNKLLTAALEQEVTASKRQRDAAALEINAYILRLQEGGKVWAQHTESMAESMRTFRMP